MTDEEYTGNAPTTPDVLVQVVELPVREPSATFGIYPLPDQGAEEGAEEITDFGDGGAVLGMEGDSEAGKCSHGDTPHVHVVRLSPGTTIGDLLGFAKKSEPSPVEQFDNELKEVFPDVEITIDIKTSYGKTYSVSTAAPLPHSLADGYTRLHQNQLALSGLFQAAVRKITSDLDLDQEETGLMHQVDIRCRPTGGLTATWNGIADKHRAKVGAEAAEEQASTDNAGAQ